MKKSPRAFSLIELSIVIAIVGLLLGLTIQGNRVTTQIRVNSAKSLTQSSGVFAIDALSLWLETTADGAVTNADGSNNPDDGDKVASWNDYNKQLINKSNATQATDAIRPTFATKSINGLPAIKFNGTSTYLSLTNLFTKSFTVFVVLRTAVAGGAGHAYGGEPILWADAQTNGLDGIPLAIGSSFAKTFNGSPDSTLTGSRTIGNDKAHLVMTSREIVTGGRTIYVDGVSDGSDTNGASSLILKDATNVLIGGNTISPHYFNGYIGEIIAFERTLSNEERKVVEAYLGKKWGIKV